MSYGLPTGVLPALSLPANRIESAAGGATNTIRPLTHHQVEAERGLAVNATQDNEQWRQISGWDYYEVSDQGRIRAVRSKRLRKLDKDRHGYPVVKLCAGRGMRRKIAVHQLVLAAFVGPRPPSCEVRHLNDIRDDNRLSNLAFGTRSENMYDAVRNGSHNRASRNACCRGHEYLDGTHQVRLNKKNGRTFRYCMICDRIRRRGNG